MVKSAALAILGLACVANFAGCGSGTGSSGLSGNPGNTAPSVSSITPSSVVVGSAATTVTVNGANFTATTSVSVGSQAEATTYVSSTQLTAVVPASQLATPAVLSLVAANTAGSSTGVSFTVANALPTITQLAPAAILAGSASTAVTVTGTGFISGTVIDVNGSARTTTYNSATQVTVSVTAADLATVGTLSITAVNPTPGGGSSAAASLLVTGTGQTFTGKVMAGSQPLIGATVQFYAAGTTGNGSAGTALFSPALTTDSTGSFTVPTNDYYCPSATAVVYLVATGGHLSTGGSSNSASTLMSSAGLCTSLTSHSSFVVNELTTVAAAYAFEQFLSAGPQLGATATNTSGISLAASSFANLVNPATGTAPGISFPATGTAPTANLYSLANAVNACVVSTGSGSSACSTLFSSVYAKTAPTNTFDALVDIAKSPAAGVAAIYALTSGSSAYTGALTAAPSDWTLYITYQGGGMNDPSALSIDSKGNVWVANYFSTASLFSNTGTPVFATGITGDGQGLEYGGAVDANDVMWLANEPGPTNSYASSVSLINSGGTAVTGSPYTAGGLNFPISIAVDATNVSWIVDYGNSHLTLLSNSGAAQSGTAGYDGVDASGNGNFIFPVAVAVDSSRNGWVANQSSNTVTKVSTTGPTYTSYVVGNGPSGVAVDASSNVWVANYYGDSVGLVSSTGTVLSGSGYTGGGIVHPQGIAADGAGNVWIANYRGPSISEIAGVGASAGTGAVLSPAAGYGSGAKLLEAFALAIDASGNIWVTNFGNNQLTEFVGLAAPVKTPLLGPTRVP